MKVVLRIQQISLIALVIFVFNLGALGAQDANTLIYGLTLDPSGFDPHINQSAEIGIVLRQVYDTLIYRHPETGEFVPGLATRWEVSEDEMTYTLYLRTDVLFHDGTPFNATAVAVNLDRIVNPEIASQKARYLLGSYSGYELVDDYTIRMILAEPYAPLLDSLSQVYLGMASPTALAQHSTERYQFNQVGTGPYIFSDFIPGDHVALERNPAYVWGPEFYQNPSIDTIDYRFFTDPVARSLSLEGGLVDAIGEIPATDARILAANPDFQLIPTTIPGQPLQYMMNVTQSPTDELAVRQALIYGANRTLISETVFQGFSEVAWGPLSSSTLYYSNEVVGRYDHDLEKAIDLLVQAGYEDTDADGIRERDGQPLTVKVIVPSWGSVPEVSQLLKDQWSLLGVETVLEVAPTFFSVLDAVEVGEYNLVAFYSFGVDPSLLNNYYLTDAQNNWMNYSNPELDQVLEDAVRVSDPIVRAGGYQWAQTTIMDEALILPIRDYTNLNATNQTVQGLQFDAYGWFPVLPNVQLDRNQ
ncbi:MAG: ABC transporter substrate-binding protein [Phototrophicaceae bacterium]